MDQTSAPPRPTPRQLEAIALFAQGMTYVEIGREMIISQWTVKDTLDDLRERVDARNTSHAIAVCVIYGWLIVIGDELLVAELEPEPASASEPEQALVAA